MNLSSPEPAVRRQRLYMPALITIYCVANLLFSFVLPQVWSSRPPRILLLVFLGFLAVQPALIGIWAAIGPGALLTRGPKAVTGMAFAVLAANLQALDSTSQQHMNAQLIVITLVCFPLAAFAAWMLRCISGYSVVDVASYPREASAQFSLKYLLGLTAAWSVILAIFGSTQQGEAFYVLLLPAVVNAVFLLVLMFPCLLLVAPVLSDSEYWQSLVRIVLGVTIPLAMMVILLAAVFLGDSSRESIVASFTAFLTGAVVCSLGSMGMVRRAGYRLKRINPPGHTTAI